MRLFLAEALAIGGFGGSRWRRRRMRRAPLGEKNQKWYEGMKRRFAAHPNRALAEAFANRHRVHFLKLCAIYELSSSASLTLSEDSFERAVQMARRIEETIFTLLKTNFSSEGVQSQQLEETIRAKGSRGLSKTELYDISRGSRFYEIDGRIKTLVEAGLVKYFQRKSGGRGRPGLFLVHRDYLEQHAKDFPHDEEARG